MTAKYTEKDLERARKALFFGVEAASDVAQALAEVREECAKICDAHSREMREAGEREEVWVAELLAKQIRELGK